MRLVVVLKVLEIEQDNEEVFKTNIDNAEQADSIKNIILEHFPYYKNQFRP
ncbi:hypothetical protein [Ferruginibacter sp.]|nr:hypothetical protein [Ferruginibacter sp.]